MYIMFCSSTDISAQWAVRGLSRLLPQPMEVVVAEDLAGLARWEHRLTSGATQLNVRLPDGRVLCSSQVKGVINRLVAAPCAEAQWKGAAEQEYVRSELFAFYLSWLHGLGGVVLNRPSPTCLSGRYLRLSEWVHRAARAGLRTAVYRQSESDMRESAYEMPAPPGAARQDVIVAGGMVFPQRVPESVRAGAVQLARALETEMLGIQLYVDAAGDWQFAAATATPELRAGGTPLLSHVAAMLQRGRAA